MVDGNQNVEERKIGIYTGQVWHSDLTLKPISMFRVLANSTRQISP